MGTDLTDRGNLVVRLVYARCDRCGTVEQALALGGPNGATTICSLCVAEICIEVLELREASS